MLVLPIHEHGRSFHLLIISSISFFKDLKFFSYRSFICLVRVIPRYFILFVAIVKGIFLLSFSAHLVFVYRISTDFVLVNLGVLGSGRIGICGIRWEQMEGEITEERGAF